MSKVDALFDDPKLEYFSMQYHWVLEDQSLEFNDLLQIPIRNRKLVQGSFHEYFIFKDKLPGDEPAQIGADKFGELLEQLKKEGEPIDRLITWFYSMNDKLDSQGDSIMLWNSTLRRWVQGKYNPPAHISKTTQDLIIETYRTQCFEPMQQVQTRETKSSARWMNPANRSDWDNVLWEYFFKRIDAAPGLYFKQAINTMLKRQWWRKLSKEFDDTMKEGIAAERLENVQAFGNIQFELPKALVPIDQVFGNDLPDFDTYAGVPEE